MDKGTDSNFNEDEEGVDHRHIMSSSVACAATMAWKSVIRGKPLERAFALILDKVSAGMLATPFTCVIDDVNWAM